MVAIVPHSAGQLASRHAAAAELTLPRAPQYAGREQVASVLPANLQLTQHRQFVSPAQAWYSAQHDVFMHVTQALSLASTVQVGRSSGIRGGDRKRPTGAPAVGKQESGSTVMSQPG
jgi:hypothetical protein